VTDRHPERFGAYYVEHIAPRHDRKSFNCGKSSMNDFLVDRGLSQASGETYVVVPHPQSPVIMAYYTVWPDPIELGWEEPDDVDASVIQLERLAVDTRHQRRKIGQSLLVRLIVQVVEVADALGIQALNLVALDEEAKAWYLGREFGFQELAPGSRRLTLPVDTIRLLLGNKE